MQFLSTLALLIASSSLSLAAPTPMMPSEKALIDATTLVCGQYPNRDWVIIGTQKVDCVTKRDLASRHENMEKREPEPVTSDVNVDSNWIVEYRVLTI